MKNKSVLFYLLGKMRRWIPAIVIMTVVHMSSAVFGVLFALGSKNVINSAVSGEKAAFRGACLIQLVIILGIFVCTTAYRFLHDRLSFRLDRAWKQDLLKGLLQGEYTNISEYHSGELINRLNNDVRAVNEGLLSTLPGIASLATRLVAAVIVLYSMEPTITSVMLCAGILLALLSGLARRKMRDLHKAVSAAEGKVSGFLQEVLEKLMLVQAMGVEREVERRADGLLEKRYAAQCRRRNISLLANSLVNLFSYGCSFAALVWCAGGVLQGVLTVGDLTAITQLVSQLQGPLVNLSGIFPKYVAMTAAGERLMEMDMLCRQTASAEEPHETLEDCRTLYDHMTALRAENLSFSYGRDQVFQNSSFTLSKGVFAVITGPSGIGKSTLLKLLLEIIRPDSGTLYLDGSHGSKQLDRTTRRLFAYVPQGNLLFSGTLRENLTLTRPNATEAQLQQAIYVSCMDAFIDQLPEGLETMLGENAYGLSEGQAQRLAIARAILGGSPILLLDECTSALDIQTEQLVLQRLRELKERTILAVTHRPAALALADWQLEVSDGEIRTKKKEEHIDGTA